MDKYMLDFPWVRQRTNFSCGAASLLGVLQYYGFDDIDEHSLADELNTTEKGTKYQNIEKTCKDYGLKCRVRSAIIGEVLSSIARDIPVIINLQAWGDKDTDYATTKGNGHYATAIGFNGNNLIFADPSSIPRVYLPFEDLEKRWHDTAIDGKDVDHLAIFIFGKPPNFSTKKIKYME